MAEPRRVGVMGGTFNPPHIGHLVCASEACDQMGLDRVLWMPNHTPPHKEIAVGAPTPAERLELCELAVGDDPRFVVSDIEIRRGGASYTVDTLQQVQEQEPGAEIVLIVGADTALSFPTWRSPDEVCRRATLGIAGRQGVLRRDIIDRLRDLPARLRFFEMPRIDISSSEIRRRLVAGQSVDYLTPGPVAERLRRGGLYRSEVHA